MKLSRFIPPEVSHPSSFLGILLLQSCAASQCIGKGADEAIREIAENKATICYLPSATRAVKIWYSNSLIGVGQGK
jgi:hypothetical protein